jgi:hypothetical protein
MRSNLIIHETLVKAQCLSAKALETMSKANEMCIAEHNHSAARLHKECTHCLREFSRLQQRQDALTEKLHQEQSSLVEELQSNSNTILHSKAREKVAMESMKLKKQRSIWQKRLAKIDLASKDQISKQRECMHNMVQQRVDRTSALESQLMEIIKGLEWMNSELVDKAKSTKKAKHEAVRLYDKSNKLASR